MRAHRCYEVAEYAQAVGHNKVFCKGTCLECDYYRIVHQQNANVLTITDNDILAQNLKRTATNAPFNLEFADCEYACSAVVDRFRPDFAIVDCSLGETTVRDMITHLVEDPRIPHVRVILAVETPQEVDKCDKEIFGWMIKPFSADNVIECISSLQNDEVAE